jgi:hypothetical protein
MNRSLAQRLTCKRGGEKTHMNNTSININTATYVGIDAHPTEHTAVAMNRFEDNKGKLRFPNTLPGIQEFLSWLPTIEKHPENTVIGIEGRGYPLKAGHCYTTMVSGL